MTTSTLFLLGLLLTLVSAVTIVVYLRDSLHRILVELCGTAERAQFWVSFSNVSITLVPVIFAMQYTPELKGGNHTGPRTCSPIEMGIGRPTGGGAHPRMGDQQLHQTSVAANRFA